MSKPLVSVVIPAYNRAAYITRAVSSIQNQSFRDLEIIVADDGSKDNTTELVVGLATRDARIRYLKHPVNRGAQAARNTGARSAQGEWIAFLDSDDEFLPTSLEIRLLEAEKRNVKVVHSEGFIEYSNTGQRSLLRVCPLAGSIYKDVLTGPGPVFPALLVHVSAMKEIEYLDENIVSHQEWDTSIRLAKSHEFGFVPEPTFVYYRHADETISADLLRTARGYEQVFEKHKAEIKSRLGRKALAKHYAMIAMLYASDKNGKYAALILKYLALAMMNYPLPRHPYRFLRSLLNR